MSATSSAASLCQAVKSGQLHAVEQLLRTLDSRAINAVDGDGFNALMHAARSDAIELRIVQQLLDRRADPNAVCKSPLHNGARVLALAVSAGDPQKVACLLDAGADLSHSYQGYGALINAVYGRDVRGDARLLPLLQLLVDRGAALDEVSPYGESALRALSRLGRFDAVALLLEAGADESQLAWTPLIRAVALGTLTDVEAVLVGADLEARDGWERSAWLVAVLSGDVEKAMLLRDRGADIHARGRNAQPALFYAIEAAGDAMLRWLLQAGLAQDVRDSFGESAAEHAAELGNAQALQLLLAAGLDVDAVLPERPGATALHSAANGAIARQLLEAGADPQHLQYEQRRELLGLPPEPDADRLQVSAAEFESGRRRRFGAANPQEMPVPFWLAMIRAGVDGYTAGERFGLKRTWSDQDQPVWCAQRFGQSLTFLPDGRTIQVAGEHEDSYDPDFCIYNDVFVHSPDGSVRIYGYPESVFPPTDFHTATLIGNQLWLIGSLGYFGARRPGEVQVFCLDTDSLRMKSIVTQGDSPGWISRHRAVLQSPTEIRISGGKVIAQAGGKETYLPNASEFVLDLQRRCWRRVG